MVSSLLQTLYNLADAFWLGKLGKAALVAPTVTMTEILTHLEATNRLAAKDRARCVEYLATYGTVPAKEWAAARR
jgi:hypothetical protein